MKRSGYFSNIFTIINNAFLKNKFLRNAKSIYYYVDGINLLFIKKTKKQKSEKKKIFIVYNLSLGDGAMFNCALKNIREIYPKEKYEITIATQRGLNSIYEATGLFDKVLGFNFTKFAVSLTERRKIFKELRKEYYDILLDPIGIEECSTNILISRVVCADKKIGVINYGRKITCPKKIYDNIYNEYIEFNNSEMHLIDHYFEFFNKIGNCNYMPELIDLPRKEIKEKNIGDFFIVYPSASTEYKRWPVDRFAEITKRIYKKLNIPLVICGTSVDRKINDELIDLIKDEVKYIDLTDRTSILEYIDLIKKAKFVITNDTGIYHVAVVSQVPVVITAGAYTWDRYLIYNFNGNEKYKRPYIVPDKRECANCDNRCIYEKQIKHTWPCLNEITIDKTWNTVERMINEGI